MAPGTVLFDVGDLVRSGAATGREDAADPAAVGVRRRRRGRHHGRLHGRGAGFLTDGERRAAAPGRPADDLRGALRFLTDHLDGDVYFHVDRPGQNLTRARAQLALLDRLNERRR